MKRPIPALLTLMALAALACSFTGGGAPTPAPLTTSASGTLETLTPAPPTALPGGSGPCEAIVTTDVPVYTRPSLTADEFGALSPGIPVTLSGRTADGWLGFDPAVAQAANMGVFRLRWIPPETELTLSGDCASVPVEPWVPEPGVCYQMSMAPVDVFLAPDPGAAAAAVLNVGDFAAVDARTASGWLLVNGFRANTPDVFGFIKDTEANFNGPCDALPEITD
jgi:hypothetical protein